MMISKELTTGEVFKVLKSMPPLPHFVGKLDGENFDIDRSEVFNWIWGKDEVRRVLKKMMFRYLVQSGVIVYDKKKNVWMVNEDEWGRPIKHQGYKRERVGRPKVFNPDDLLKMPLLEGGAWSCEWQRWAKQKLGMSRGSFFVALAKFRKEGKVIKNFEKKWVLVGGAEKRSES